MIMFCCTYSANSAIMLTYCTVTEKMFIGSEKNRVLFILHSFFITMMRSHITFHSHQFVMELLLSIQAVIKLVCVIVLYFSADTLSLC